MSLLEGREWSRADFTPNSNPMLTMSARKPVSLVPLTEPLTWYYAFPAPPSTTSIVDS